MIEKEVVITTKNGRMPTFAACPDGPGSFPGIIFYMDAPGMREELRNMARRIAKHGYFCLLPDMYYRLGTCHFDLLHRDDGMSAVIRAAMNHLTNARVVDDTSALLAYLDAQEAAKPGPVGCVGHCMSGQYITTVSAHFPHRMAAAASLYGVGIITDKEDSPHLLLDKIKGELYYAFAETIRPSPPTFRASSSRRSTRPTPNTSSKCSRAPITASASRSARFTTRSPPRRPGAKSSRCGTAA